MAFYQFDFQNLKLFWYCKAPCQLSLTLCSGLLNISRSSKEAIRQKGLHFMVFRCMAEARWRILRRTWEVRECKGQEGLRRVCFAFPSVRTRMTPASGNKYFEITLFASAFLPVLLRQSQSSREPRAFSQRKWVKLSNAQKINPPVWSRDTALLRQNLLEWSVLLHHRSNVLKSS